MELDLYVGKYSTRIMATCRLDCGDGNEAWEKEAKPVNSSANRWKLACGTRQVMGKRGLENLRFPQLQYTSEVCVSSNTCRGVPFQKDVKHGSSLEHLELFSLSVSASCTN